MATNTSIYNEIILGITSIESHLDKLKEQLESITPKEKEKLPDVQISECKTVETVAKEFSTANYPLTAGDLFNFLVGLKMIFKTNREDSSYLAYNEYISKGYFRHRELKISHLPVSYTQLLITPMGKAGIYAKWLKNRDGFKRV